MKPLRSLTQKQKIIYLMLKSEGKEWFFPYDFMQPELGDLFVGYKAGTRISELAKDYPFMFGSKESGKYVVRRLKLETIKDWLYDLPKDLRYVFHRAGVTQDIQKPAPEVKQIVNERFNI